MTTSFRRLSYASNLCSVHYTGPVDGTSGTWLGVEWDNPTLGKHTGTHNGKQYFTCRSPSPNAGSFIRPTRPHDEPRSFLAALREKYVATSLDESSNTVVIAPPKNFIYFNGKLAEEVGFEKVARQQAELGELKVVVLGGMRIGGLMAGGEEEGLGDEEWDRLVDEVKETCGRIVELDLSRNLIASWVQAAGICLGLQGLRRLTLNGNRFRRGPIPRLDQCRMAFEKVEELSLEGMLLSWSEIIEILKLFPSLQTLSLGSNNLSGLLPSLPTPNLTSLNLSFNPISIFSSISSLSTLPRLMSLTLRSCSFTNLPALPSSFRYLRHLDLVSNDLASISDLNTICISFPQLTSFRCSSNPFYANLPSDEAFMLTLALIPSLTTLNFSSISVKERENAELYYLSRIRTEISSQRITSIDTLRISHPLLDYLADEHGQKDDITTALEYQQQHSGSDAASVNPNSLAAHLVEISFYQAQLANEDEPDGKPKISLTMSIPNSTSIYRLKSLVGRKLDLLPRVFRLVWETGEVDPVGQNIRNPGRVGEGERIAHAESEDEDAAEDAAGDRKKEEVVRWVKREVELIDSTRPLGSWIEGRQAMVRIEKI